MPTPNIDRMADEGMTLFDFYAQPSCTPGRAAVQTGRIPNRSGMTTVTFQGQGGGLPKAEWTLAAVLKRAGYKTFFTGKWHLGEGQEKAGFFGAPSRRQVRMERKPSNRPLIGKLRVQVVKDSTSSVYCEHCFVVANERLGRMSQAASVAERVESI